MSDRASSSSSSPLPGSEADAVFPSSLASAECCEEHEEYLSLFCLDELEPLCKHCAADSHARHRVYLSAEAAIDCKVGIWNLVLLVHFTLTFDTLSCMFTRKHCKSFRNRNKVLT